MKILKKNNISLRPVEPEDLEILYKWENDTDIWHISNTITPFSKFVLKQYLETSHLDIYETKQFRFIIDLEEKPYTFLPVGTVDLFDFDPFHSRLGVGILIKEDQHRQKGYASTALEILINYAFATLLVHQLYCNIDTDNEISLNLFKKFNFKITGEKLDWCKTANGWKNEYLLQLINPSYTGAK